MRRRHDDARHRRLLDGDRGDPRLPVRARGDLRRSERHAGDDARAGDRRDGRVLDGPEDSVPVIVLPVGSWTSAWSGICEPIETVVDGGVIETEATVRRSSPRPSRRRARGADGCGDPGRDAPALAPGASENAHAFPRSSYAGRRFDVHRSRTIHPGTVAQLAVEIVAPAERLARGRRRARVRAKRADRGERMITHDADWFRRILRSRRRPAGRSCRGPNRTLRRRSSARTCAARPSRSRRIAATSSPPSESLDSRESRRPSWPPELFPQQYASPRAVTPQACVAPVAIDRNVSPPATGTGDATVGDRSVAELAVGVLAPAERAADVERAGEIPSERERGVAMIAGHEGRQRRLRWSRSRMPSCPCEFDPQHSASPWLSSAQLCAAPTSSVVNIRAFGDSHRRLMRHRRTVAELSAFVLAPAPRRPAARDGAAVRQPGRDGDEPNVSSDCQRRSDGARAARAELSAVVPAPAVRSSLGVEHARMQTARRHRHARRDRSRNWRNRCRRGSRNLDHPLRRRGGLVGGIALRLRVFLRVRLGIRLPASTTGLRRLDGLLGHREACRRRRLS